MVSIRASLTQFYLRHSKYKKIFSGQGDVQASIAKLHAIPPALPTSRFRRKYDVSESQFQGQPVYTICSRNSDTNNGHNIDIILYLHGGGYVGAISPFHWYFIGRLIDTLNVTVIVPFYPRAPHNDVDANFAFMMPFYDDLLTRHDPKNMIVMGDSAGAGLSLALTQQCIAAGKTPPAKIILLSPWLEGSGNDPRQNMIEKNDCLLGIAGLQACGRAYAGKNSISDVRVSPGLGSLSQMPPIAMFAGTYDILLTDARNFKTRIDASETPVQLSYHEYEKMHHVWMILPCPETDKCIEQIDAFVRA